MKNDQQQFEKTLPPFKLAIIGIGKISYGSHIPAALSSPLVKLVGFVDPETGRAQQIANEFGLSVEIASSITDMKGEVDGALIATPNHLHAPLAIECLQNGMHALIEKPLASTVQEGLDIIDMEKQSGKRVAVGYCTRFYPNFQLLKDLLDEGYFGTVKKFAYQFGTPGGWATFSNYLMKRQHIGGGVLVVTGTHFLDRMLHLFGFPDDIQLKDDSLGGPEANARMFMKFGQGAEHILGYVHFSKTTALPSGLVLDTEKGHVLLPDNMKDLVLYPHDQPDLAINLSRINGKPSPASQFQQQIEDFVLSCQLNRKPMVSAEEGLLSLRLLEKAYQHREALPDTWYEKNGRVQ
ncbi:MAG: oxidoreductase [Nitrospirales bacterium]|nr:MAG: oxidoreductase [Nitrospirales bacterium]